MLCPHLLIRRGAGRTQAGGRREAQVQGELEGPKAPQGADQTRTARAGRAARRALAAATATAPQPTGRDPAKAVMGAQDSAETTNDAPPRRRIAGPAPAGPPARTAAGRTAAARTAADQNPLAGEPEVVLPRPAGATRIRTAVGQPRTTAGLRPGEASPRGVAQQEVGQRDGVGLIEPGPASHAPSGPAVRTTGTTDTKPPESAP